MDDLTIAELIEKNKKLESQLNELKMLTALYEQTIEELTQKIKDL